MPQSARHPSGYLSIKEWAESVGIQYSTANNYTYRDRVPFLRKGKKLFIKKGTSVPARRKRGPRPITVPSGYLSVKEWAKSVGIPRVSAYSYIHKSRVPFLRKGEQLFIKKGEPVPARGRRWPFIAPSGYQTIKEWAKSVGIPGMSAYSYIYNGRVPFLRKGKKLFIKKGEPTPNLEE